MGPSAGNLLFRAAAQLPALAGEAFAFPEYAAASGAGGTGMGAAVGGAGALAALMGAGGTALNEAVLNRTDEFGRDRRTTGNRFEPALRANPGNVEIQRIYNREQERLGLPVGDSNPSPVAAAAQEVANRAGASAVTPAAAAAMQAAQAGKGRRALAPRQGGIAQADDYTPILAKAAAAQTAASQALANREAPEYITDTAARRAALEKETPRFEGSGFHSRAASMLPVWNHETGFDFASAKKAGADYDYSEGKRIEAADAKRREQIQQKLTDLAADIAGKNLSREDKYKVAQASAALLGPNSAEMPVAQERQKAEEHAKTLNNALKVAGIHAATSKKPSLSDQYDQYAAAVKKHGQGAVDNFMRKGQPPKAENPKRREDILALAADIEKKSKGTAKPYIGDAAIAEASRRYDLMGQSGGTGDLVIPNIYAQE